MSRTLLAAIMSEKGVSEPHARIELGTYEVGARFTIEHRSPHVLSDVRLTIDLWDVDAEPCSIELNADDVLTLAQFLDWELDR